jgi:hypothetical protein
LLGIHENYGQKIDQEYFDQKLSKIFIIALAIWDKRSVGRIHPITLWGGLVIIISQPLRLIISSTAIFMNFTEWATGILR